MKKLLLMLVLIGFKFSFGQVSIPMHNTDYTTNFNGWNGTLPTGFSHSGSGSTYRGTSAASTTGGTYAVSGGGYGYQPSSSSSSLTLTGTFRNTTGSTITELSISYEAFTLKTNPRTPAWTVTSSLGSVSSLNWNYNPSATPGSPDLRAVTLTGLNIANNQNFTIVFSSDRGGGSGSSPKIGLNNLTVKSISAPPCSISTSGLANLTCNNNATPGTTTDDFLTFDLNPTGTSIGTNYNVSVNNGSISPTSASFGSATSFTLNNGSAGGGNVIVTITDATTGTCTLPVNITDPGACSTPCSVNGTDTQTACDSLEWIDGNTYYTNNSTATFNIVGGAANGCDSLVTLDLTILNSATGTDVQTACNTFQWIDGNDYTTSNNTATFNIVGGAANGCDSLVTLDLTILNSATGTDVQTACDSLEWIDGNTYYTSNNIATFNIVGGAANGCDSLVTLNLTINTADVTVTTQDPTITANATNANYQWIDCSDNSEITGETNATFTATNNGSYAVEVTENGCTATSTCVDIIKVGLDETIFSDVKIYPNPNNGKFIIDLGELDHPTVLIYSIDNKLVYFEASVEKSVLPIELIHTPGVYFVRITNGNHALNSKIVVE